MATEQQCRIVYTFSAISLPPTFYRTPERGTFSSFEFFLLAQQNLATTKKTRRKKTSQHSNNKSFLHLPVSCLAEARRLFKS
jgi:hypothetical protein